MNLKEYVKKAVFISEAISQTDIIDAYILMAMPDIHDPAAQFDKKQILDQAEFNIIDELTRIVEKELSHLDGQSEDYYNIKMSIPMLQRNKVDLEYEGVWDGLNLLSKIFGLARAKSPEQAIQNKQMYVQAFNQLQAGVSKKHKALTLQQIYNCFKFLEWDEEYGGDNWAFLTSKIMNLVQAKTPKDKLHHLDRLVDYVHNTSEFINKFKGFKQGWMQFILDIKGKAINIRELIPYASPVVRKMFASPEWRGYLQYIPGEGAERSMKTFQQLLPQYIEKIIESESDTHIIRYMDAIARVMDKLGKSGTNEVLDTIPKKTIQNMLDIIDSIDSFATLSRKTGAAQALNHIENYFVNKYPFKSRK